MNPKNAQTVATIVALTFVLVGGYFVRGIPHWISWVKYISFIYWAFGLLLKIQFGGAQYYSCIPPNGGGNGSAESPAAAAGGGGGGDEGNASIAAAGGGGVGCVVVEDLQTVLQFPTDPDAAAWPDALVLVAMLVAYRVAVYVVLRRKTRLVA